MSPTLAGRFFTTKPSGKFTGRHSGNPCTCLILSTMDELCSIIPVLQRRTLRLGEVTWLAPGHRAGEVVAPVFEARSVWPQRPLSPPCTIPLGYILQMPLCWLPLTRAPEPIHELMRPASPQPLPDASAGSSSPAPLASDRGKHRKEGWELGVGKGSRAEVVGRDSAHPSPGPVPPLGSQLLSDLPKFPPKSQPPDNLSVTTPQPHPGVGGAPSQAPSASGPARIQANRPSVAGL